MRGKGWEGVRRESVSQMGMRAVREPAERVFWPVPPLAVALGLRPRQRLVLKTTAALPRAARRPQTSGGISGVVDSDPGPKLNLRNQINILLLMGLEK